MIKNSLGLRLRLEKKMIGFFLTLICLSAGSLSDAQTPAEIPVIPVKSAMDIETKDGLLSVELSDAEFGKVIKEISDKAGFKVEISSDVAYKRVSTTFKDVDIEKGIRRMLNLIKEKDFTISYTEAGLIDKLEIYGNSGKQFANQSQKKNVMPQKPYMSPQAPVFAQPPALFQPVAPSQPPAPPLPAPSYQQLPAAPNPPVLPRPPSSRYLPPLKYQGQTVKPIQPQPEVPAKTE